VAHRGKKNRSRRDDSFPGRSANRHSARSQIDPTHYRVQLTETAMIASHGAAMRPRRSCDNEWAMMDGPLTACSMRPAFAEEKIIPTGRADHQSKKLNDGKTGAQLQKEFLHIGERGGDAQHRPRYR
jgi:hypothetical protein